MKANSNGPRILVNQGFLFDLAIKLHLVSVLTPIHFIKWQDQFNFIAYLSRFASSQCSALHIGNMPSHDRLQFQLPVKMHKSLYCRQI